MSFFDPQSHKLRPFQKQFFQFIMNRRISKGFGTKIPTTLLGHNKHRSMGCSPTDSPFIIKKQTIRIKEEKSVLSKWNKMKRKQSTNHHNEAYQNLLKKRKDAIDWIKYNMTIGLAFIWNRLRQQLKRLGSFYQNTNQPSKNISKNPDTPSPHRLNQDRFNNLYENLNNLFEQLNKTLVKNQKNQKSLFRVANKHKRQTVRVSQDMEASHQQKDISKLGDGQHIRKLGQNVVHLNSMLCLLQRDILLRKQEIFVDDFLKRGGVGKSVKQIQQITHILKISQQRCKLMKQMIQSMHLLHKNQKAILASQKLIDKLSHIDLEKEIASIPEHYKQNAVKSRFKQIKSAIAVTLDLSPTILNDSNQTLGSSQILPKVSQKLQMAKAKRNHRASIEEHLNNFMSHNSQAIIKQKSKSSFKLTDHKVIAPSLKKTVKKVHLIDNKQNVQTSHKRKPQSGVSMKSRKEITWQDLKEKQVKSLKYLRSLRSLRSITSHQSANSSKFLRSQKTQREMKFLKLKSRRMHYPAFLRTKFMKIEGFQDFQSPTQKDCLGLTSDRQRNTNKPTSLQNFQISQNQISGRQDHFEQTNQNQDDMVAIQPIQNLNNEDKDNELEQLQKKIRIKKEIRGIKRKECIEQHPILKEDVLRSFFSHFSTIKNEKNIIKQKYLVLNQLEQMKEAEIVSQSQYEHFKGLFQNKPKVNPSIQKNEQKKKNEHYYLQLADLKSKISQTKELNQINKYYYNINQFKVEEEQIQKTKHLAPPKEDFLFHIKTSIYYRQNDKPKISFKKNPLRIQSALYQKNI